MNKWLIGVILFVAVLVLISIFTVWKNPSGYHPQVTCVAAGERLDNPSARIESNLSCCSGLSPIAEIPMNEREQAQKIGAPPLGGWRICSACGNANCEDWETNLTCQSDCR